MALVVSPQRRKGYSSKRPEGNAEGLVEGATAGDHTLCQRGLFFWIGRPSSLKSTCPTNGEESSSAIQYQALNVKVAVQREHSYYVRHENFSFIDLCLVRSSLLVLLVPASQFEDRMGLSLTLLLTAVAF